MAGYDGRASDYPLTIVRDADMAFTVTASDGDGVAIDLSLATIDAELYDKTGAVVVTMSEAVTGDNSEIVTLSLTDTQTTDLVASSWTMWVTRGGDKRPWLAGRVTVGRSDKVKQSTDGAAVSVTVDSNVNVTATINAIGGVTTGIDGGTATSNYGGTTAIDGGSA